MTAGMVASLTQRKNFKEAFVFGSALATASTLQLEPGEYSERDFDLFLKEANLEIYSG